MSAQQNKAKRLLIRGGTVVDPSKRPGLFAADVLVENGKIAAIGAGLVVRDVDILRAAGCWVMPGGIDPHTHFELDNGLHVHDDFASGTLAALWGGNTCVIEHPGFGPEGCGPLYQMETYQQLAKGHCHTDYGLHLVFQPGRTIADGRGLPFRQTLMELPAAVRQGYVSGKAYTTYEGKLEDKELLELMAAMKSARCLLAVHCENDTIPAWLRRHNPFPETDPRAYPASRPDRCEAEAITRVLALAAIVDVPIYVVHVSSAAGLRAIREARSRGQKVFAETCPQYLLLTEERYGAPSGLSYIMAPPLRQPEDCQALWKALDRGEIDVIATDHCAFSQEHKKAMGAESVFNCPGGIPGVETRLPLLFTHGVLEGRISLERFVAVTSRNPARIFGLPGKGRIEVGLDADLLVLDPDTVRKLDQQSLHQRVDYSPFAAAGAGQGRGVARGWPRHVLLRGNVVLRDGEVQDLPPMGQFVRRTA